MAQVTGIATGGLPRLWPILLLLVPFLTGTKRQPIPLHEQSYQAIIKKYFLIADFAIKPETRPINGEVFWRYPMAPAPAFFAINHDIDAVDLEKTYPRTDGEGRAVEHLNLGRTQFLEGNWEDAKNTFLGARARYGKKFEFHRRVDYYIAYSFLNMAMEQVVKHGKSWDDVAVKTSLNNAATFLSWAFKIKQDIPDPVVDRETPRGLYNLAAIYFRYQRYAGAFGAATDGLNHLRQFGFSTYRPQLRRILAESHIQNRSYLQAAQELDLSLRQDPDPRTAGQIFARLGDLYFDVNNFELAEELYAIANRVDHQVQYINPTQFVLRGEALFWLGQFSEAQKMYQYALNTVGNRQIQSELSPSLAAVASIRMADAWLAQRNIEKAKVAYATHIHNFRTDTTSDYAKIRLGCLELPFYEGKNILHARSKLADLKGREDSLHADAIEMAWACEVGSYAKHERTDAMLNRVRELASRYPTSRFLKGMVTPVMETQAAKIEAFFLNHDYYGAVEFFEKTRKNLFPKISQNLKDRLFAAYSEIGKPVKAVEFWPTDQNKKTIDDLTLIRMATNAAELANRKDQKPWIQKNIALGKRLSEHRWTIPYSDAVQLLANRILYTDRAYPHYQWIYKLYQSWARKDLPTICTVVLPLVRRIADNPQASFFTPPQAKKMEQEFVDTFLPDAVQYEPFCAYSMLDFELEINRDSPLELAQRYESRIYLTLNETTARIYWALSEQLAAQGHQKQARQIWVNLAEKGQPSYPETRYAKNRLQRLDTVYEGLWRQK